MHKVTDVIKTKCKQNILHFLLLFTLCFGSIHLNYFYFAHMFKSVFYLIKTHMLYWYSYSPLLTS